VELYAAQTAPIGAAQEPAGQHAPQGVNLNRDDDDTAASSRATRRFECLDLRWSGPADPRVGQRTSVQRPTVGFSGPLGSKSTYRSRRDASRAALVLRCGRAFSIAPFELPLTAAELAGRTEVVQVQDLGGASATSSATA
jgi:hypothetical protein